MALSTLTTSISYVGNGSTTAFSFPYKYLNHDDLEVTLELISSGAETTQTLDVDYTVTATSAATNGVYPGATITFTTAPSALYNVNISRNPVLTQEFDFDAESDPLPVITRYADFTEMKLQALSSRIVDAQSSYETSILATGSTTPRALADRFAEVYNVEDWGITSTSSATENTTNLNRIYAAIKASGAGAVVELPDYQINVNGQLTLDASYVLHRGKGRKLSVIYSTYTAAAAFVLGNSSTQTVEYAFEDCGFRGAVAGTFFWIKYVRGVYFHRVYWLADRFMRIGDSSAGTSKGAYIIHFDDIPDAGQVSSPTLHHIYAENFIGQWSMQDTYVEGQYTAGIDGFYSTENIQMRIDDFVVEGGYFSRFRDNWSFVDARLSNGRWDNHISELALRNAIRLEVTTSTSKAVANVGWEKVQIDGSFSSSADNTIFVQCERANVGCVALSFGAVVFGSECIKTPIYIQAQLGDSMGYISIASIAVDPVTPSASQYVVHIVGGSAAKTIRGVAIGPIVGRAWTTALAAVVRVEGRVGEVTVAPAIGFVNATTTVDDQSHSSTPMALTRATIASTDLATIIDQSAGHARPITVDELKGALGWKVVAASGSAQSVTGTVAKTTLATIAIPANSMAANGVLRVTAQWSFTSSANNKTTSIDFGGTNFQAWVNTTVASARTQVEIHNRNATNSQVSTAANNSGFGSSTSTSLTGAIDTTAAQNVVLSGTLANTGETITLESYTVEVLYNP